jgi:phosphopantetheinyl transferase
MPFFLRKNVFQNCVVGIWKIEEPIEYFEDKLVLHPKEKEIVEQLSTRKKKEWFATRWTLHLLSGHNDRNPCLYDAYGKPYLADSGIEISMSHSHDFVAVITGQKVVGIDIQVIVPKIYRLKKKFLSELEQAYVGDMHELEMLHVMWGAKESLFKAYGKGQLPFADAIHLEPFYYYLNGGHIKGKVEKDDYFRGFDIEYLLIENYMLVYAVEA